jgi:hypothetical protein
VIDDDDNGDDGGAGAQVVKVEDTACAGDEEQVGSRPASDVQP